MVFDIDDKAVWRSKLCQPELNVLYGVFNDSVAVSTNNDNTKSSPLFALPLDTPDIKQMVRRLKQMKKCFTLSPDNDSTFLLFAFRFVLT